MPPIAKDAAVQAAGSYAAAAAQLARGLILARLLGPEGIGTVAVIAMLVAYGTYQDLGLSTAAAREIPLSVGRGRPGEVDDWRLHALAANLIGGAVFALMVIAIVLARGGALPGQLRLGLFAASAMLIMQGLSVAQTAILTARKQFVRAAALTAGPAAMGLVAVVAGALAAGVVGVFAGMVLTALATAATAMRLGGLPRGRRLRAAAFVRLLKAGLPLSAISFATYNLVQLDQIVVLAFLDRRTLGIYVPVLYIGTALMLIPRSLALSVGPRLLQRYGQTSTLEAISELTWRPVKALSTVMPPAIMAAWLLGGILIDRFLPLYRDAIGPLRIYLVGIFFLALNLGPSTTLQATGKYLLHLPIVAGAVAFNVAIDFVLVRRLGLGLTGVALGSAVSYFLYWFAHTFLVRHLYDPRALKVAAFNLGAGWPGIVLAGLALFSWKAGLLGRSQPLPELSLLALTAIFTLPRLAALRRPAAA